MMNEDVKISVGSDSSAARRDIGQLGLALQKVTDSARRSADASAKVGKSVTGSFKEIKAPMDQTADGFTKLTRLAIGFATAIAAGAAVNVFYRISDELTQVNNKLRLVSKSQFELVGLQRQIVDLSMQTNSALRQTADLYFNISRGARASGMGQRELLALTKTIQQTVVVSGSSAESSNAAILQLNQGLSSGTLRGEELNSVMEQLPRLAQILTDKLGVSAGELRKIAEKGELTTKVVLGAIKEQASQIESEFNSVNKTVAMASTNFSTQFKLLVGVIDTVTNSSVRLVSYINKAANSLSEFTPRIQSSIFLAKKAINQYIYDLRSFSTAALTVRKVLETLSFSQMLSIYRGYENSRKAIKAIDAFLVRIGLVKAEQSKLSKFTEDLKGKMGLDGLFDFNLDFMKFPEAPLKSFGDRLKEIGALIFAIVYAFTGLFAKISSIIPQVFLPVQTATSLISRFVQLKFGTLFKYFEQSFTRLSRYIEAAFDISTFYSASDTSLERTVSRLFRSESLIEFTSNLNTVGDTLRDLRGGDLAIFAKDGEVFLKSIREGGKSILMFLNIIDNRFVVFNNIRFDRIANAFKILGSVIEQVYEDNLRFPLQKALFKIRFIAGGIADAIYDTISDSLTTGNAEKLGKLAFNSIVGIVNGFSALLNSGVFSKNIFEKMFDLSDSFPRLKKSLITIFEFIVNFFKTLGINTFNLLPKYIRDMVTAVISEASRLSGTALKYIREFTESVGRAFFEVYDKVVGNSYWPDLIDGVIGHTSRLDVALAKVKKFTAAVSEQFAPLKNRLFDALSNNSVTRQIVGVDYDEIQNNLYRATAAAISAAMLLAFGGLLGKAIAASSIVSIFESTVLFPLLNGMSTNIGVYLPEEIAKALGTGFAIFAKTAVSSLLEYMDVLIRSLPSLVSAALVEFGIIGAALNAFINIVTFGQNGLLYTMLFGYLGYAAITGKLKDVLKFAKSVGSYILPLLRFTPNSGRIPSGIPWATQIENKKKGNIKNSGKKNKNLMSVSIFGAEANPALLIAGILAVASTFTDAVSLFQGLVAGIPLFSFAFLGKDGGARLIVSLRKKLLNIFIAVTSGSFPDLTEKITNIFMGKGGKSGAYVQFGKDLAGSVFSPIVNLAKTSGRGIVNALQSASKNKKAFAEGSISISKLFKSVDSSGQIKFFRGVAENIEFTQNKANKLKQSWLAVKQEFSKPGSINGLSSTLSAATVKLSGWANLARSGVGEIFRPIGESLAGIMRPVRGQFGNLVTSVKSLFTSLALDMASSFSAIGGKNGLLGILLTGPGGKIAIVAALTAALALFATSASAGIVSQVAELSLVEKLLQSIGTFAAVIASSFVVIPGLVYLIVGLTNGWKIAGEVALGTFTRMTLVAAAIGRVIVGIGAAFGEFFMLVFRSFFLPMLTKKFWTSLGGIIVKLFSVQIPMAFARGALIIKSSIVAIKIFTTSMVASFVAVGGAIAFLSKAFWTLAVTAYFGLINIKLIFAAVFSFLGVMGSLVLTAGLGLLYVLLFGKGDSFLEKLEYVKDQIFSIFTGAEVKVGRNNKLNAAVQDTSLDGKKFEFQSKINSIDFSKLAAEEYNNILKVSTAAGDIIKRYTEVAEAKGAADLSLKNELDAAYRDFNRVTGRAAKLDTAQSVDKAFADLIVVLEDNSLSMSQKIRNFIVYAVNDILGLIPNSVNNVAKAIYSSAMDLFSVFSTVSEYSEGLKESNIAYPFKLIGSTIGKFIDYLIDKSKPLTEALSAQASNAVMSVANMQLLGKPMFRQFGSNGKEVFDSQPSRSRAYWDKASGAGKDRVDREELFRVSSQKAVLSELSSFLSDSEKLRIIDVADNYRKALEDIKRESKGLFFVIDSAAMKVFEEARDRAKFIFDQEIPLSVRVNLQRKSVAEYQEEITEFAKQLSANSGEKVSVEDLIFSEKVNSQLKRLALGIKKSLEESTQTADPEIAVRFRINAKALQQEYKSTFEEATNFTFLETEIDARIKIGGLDTSRAQILDLFRLNEAGYAEWIRLTDERLVLEQQIAKITKDTPRATAVDLLNKRDESQQKLQAITPKPLFERLNSAIESLGLSSISKEVFEKIGIRSLDLLENFESLKKEQDEFNATSGKLTITNYLSQWSTLNNRIIEAGKAISEITKPTIKDIASAFSDVGATAEKIRILAPDVQARLENATPARLALKGALDSEKLTFSEQRSVQLRLNSENEQVEKSKIFEKLEKPAKGKDLFERFSELVSTSGIDIKFEQMGQLASAAASKMISIITSANAKMKAIGAMKGNFPLNAKRLLDDVELLKEEATAILTSLPRSVSDSVAAAIEGTSIKAEDFINLSPSVAVGLSAIADRIRDIELAKKSLKSKGALTESDILVIQSFDAQKQALETAKKSLADTSRPESLKFTDSLASLDLSDQAVNASKFTTQQIDSVKRLGAELLTVNAVFEASGRTMQDYLRKQEEDKRLKKEASALIKTDIADRLQEIGITGVELKGLQSNIEMRSELFGVMQQLRLEYAEYQALTAKSAGGFTSSQEEARLKVLRKNREKPSVLAANAESSEPIVNLKDLSEALKIDLTDLINIPSKSLLVLRDNRIAITKLFNELGQLGTTEQDRAKFINKKIQDRLKLEEEITSQIALRKDLANTFKNDISADISALLKGDKGMLGGKIADKISTTVVSGVSDQLFGGFAKNLSKLLTPEGGPGAGIIGKVGGAFATDGALSGIGNLFRGDGALNGIGKLFGSIFGDNDNIADGSSPNHAMYVKIVGRTSPGGTSQFDFSSAIERLGLGGREMTSDNSIVGSASAESGFQSSMSGFAENPLPDTTINELSTGITGTFDSVGLKMESVFAGFGTNLSRVLSSFAGLGGGGGKFNWTAVAISAATAYFNGKSGSGGGSGGAPAGGTGLKAPSNSSFGSTLKFDKGGIVPGSIGSPQMILAHGGETVLPTHKKGFGANSTVVNLSITGDISKQTRKEIFDMLPQIATGVNAQNRESNIRR